MGGGGRSVGQLEWLPGLLKAEFRREAQKEGSYRKSTLAVSSCGLTQPRGWFRAQGQSPGANLCALA